MSHFLIFLACTWLRGLVWLSAVSAASLAQALVIPPNPNYPAPSNFEYQQAVYHDQVMAQIRQREYRLHRVRAPEPKLTLPSEGRFELDHQHFGQLFEPAPLTEARVWRVEAEGKGSYFETVALQFETFEIDETTLLDNRRVMAIDEHLQQWQAFIEGNTDIDAGVRNQLSDYYEGIRDTLSGEDLEADESILLFVASTTESGDKGAQLIPAAVALGTLEDGEAHFSWIVSNPYAQVSRSVRQDGVVGSAGQPLLDYSYRQLASLDEAERITVTAESRRVGVFSHRRGFSLCQ